MSRLRTAVPAPGVARASAPLSTAPLSTAQLSTAPLSTPTPGGVHTLGRTDDPAERFAERTAEAATTARPLFADFSFAAVPPSSPLTPSAPLTPSDSATPHSQGEGTGAGESVAVAFDGPGRAPDDGVRRAVETVTGADLRGVRVHDDAAAQDTAARAGAAALTVGQHVAFAPGRHDPRTPDGRRRLAHELAHAARGERDVVRRDPPPGGAQAPTPATTLAGLPEPDRKRIQVVTTQPINPTGLDAKFATTGTTMKLSLPPDTTVALDTTAASTTAGFEHGMRNLVAALVGTHDVAPAPLSANTTASVLLDLTRYGGKSGVYRFTYNAPPVAQGATPANRVIVEFLGTATPPAGAKEPPAPAEGEKPPADPVAEKIRDHSISHAYTGAEKEALRAAIDQVPASHLRAISGVTFTRAGVHPTKPEVAGEYSEKKHTITMFDRAFKGAQNAYVNGAIATSYAARTIIHEIGHAFDLSVLRTTNLAREKAEAARAALAAKYPDPNNPGGYSYPLGGAEEKEVKAVEKAAKDAKAAMLGARSRSGTTTIEDPASPGNFKDEIGTTTKGIAYREAALKDGLAVSVYGEEDWQESYAESYSLYLSDPATLKALRPNIHAHLVATLPK